MRILMFFFFFFFQAEDGIRDHCVTGVQTCALPIFVEEAQFDRLGAFAYSPQEGTRATQYPDDVPDGVKRDRLEELLRSEERRVGKECRSRWATEHEKKKKKK